MASPSIVLHHGLRNTRIHRASIPVSVPSLTRPPTLSTLIIPASSTSQLSSQTSTSSKAYSASSSTPLVKPLSLFDPAPSDKIHPTIPLLTADTQSTLPDVGLLPPSVTSELPSTRTGSTAPTSTLQSTASPQASVTPTEETHSSSTSPSAATGAGAPEYSSAGEPTDQRKDTLIRVLVGSIFGVIAFIVLVSLICLLLLRSRRRIYGNRKSVSSNGKLSRVDRNSAPTLTSLSPRYLSELPFHSGTPSPPSQASHAQSSSGPLATPQPVLFHNPFSKSSELCAVLPDDNRGTGEVENPFADPAPMNDRQVPKYGRPSKPSLIGLQPIPQEKTNGLVIPRSMYGSDHSLGSTIVLPGRNSSIGSFQVISYRISHPSEKASPPVDPAGRRVSTRSDPFDLEVPANAVHPRR